jgi:hypothetical protein
MITNFEDITSELTPIENKLVPVIIKGLSAKTKDNPVKAVDIVKGINGYLQRNNVSKYTFSEARLRKISNFIRCNGILPLIATSKGYYVSTDRDEIENQIKSLVERAESIMASADGLKKFLK